MAEVSVARAKNEFEELVTRAARGEHIIIRESNRPIAALISATDLERLEELGQSARQAGQDPELLREIEAGKLHPAMRAFGLWREEADLADLTERIYANRNQQPPRPGATL